MTYQYRQKTTSADFQNVSQLESVTTAGVSSESYGFDAEGRVSSKTLTMTSRSGFQFVTNYSYDKLDRVTDVLYPFQYGNGTQARKSVHHDYDITGSLTALTYDGQSFASNVVYNSDNQTTSLNVGTGANQITENYGYNAQTGLLDNQTVARSSTPTNYLLNLSYDYAKCEWEAHGSAHEDSQQPEPQQRPRLRLRRPRPFSAGDRRTRWCTPLDADLFLRSLWQSHVGEREWELGEEWERCWERGRPARIERAARQVRTTCVSGWAARVRTESDSDRITHSACP